MTIQTKQTGLATAAEAATYLRISRGMIYRLVDEGKLAKQHVGTHLRITWVSIYKFAGEEI